MYCENCGHKLNETDYFCEECGTKVNKLQAKSSNKTLWIVLGCVFGGIILLGILIFVFIISIFNYVDINENYDYEVNENIDEYENDLIDSF